MWNKGERTRETETELLQEQSETLERQALVLDLIHDAVLIHTLDGTLCFRNHGADELYGWSKDETLDQNTHALLKTEFPKPVGEIKAELISIGHWEGELVHYTRDSRRIRVVSRWVIQSDRNGTPRWVVQVDTNITERKQAEEERDRLFAISLDMLCIAGFDGYFNQLNPAWEKTLGYTVDELKSKPYLDFVHPEDREASREQAFNNSKGVDSVSFENRYLCKDGSYKWLLWNVTPFTESELIFAVARDNTDRKLAEQEHARKSEALALSNSDLEQFAYVASHDLQEPLRMVSSYCQLLEERYKGQLDEKADKFIGYAVDGAKRMQFLISDLLEYSRVGTSGGDLQPVSLNDLFARAKANLESSIFEADAVITSDDLPVVLGDPGQLIRLFQNLIGNSIKFRGDRFAKIHVAATRERDRWLLAITDNGIGIDPEYFDRIFVIFQRLHSRSEYPGTGIGLPICKRIVERHGGRIWLESSPGQGATFKFSLPVRA